MTHASAEQLYDLERQVRALAEEVDAARTIIPALRAALREEHETLVEEKVEDWATHLAINPGCEVCALLAKVGS